jgi:hypothetical protein
VKRRDDTGEARRARNREPRRRRARVLSGVTGGLRALTLELVVGERSGRRIVGRWSVSVSFSPSKAVGYIYSSTWTAIRLTRWNCVPTGYGPSNNIAVVCSLYGLRLEIPHARFESSDIDPGLPTWLARDEVRTGSEAHGDERTHWRHRPWRGWGSGHLKRCIVPAPISFTITWEERPVLPT